MILSRFMEICILSKRILPRVVVANMKLCNITLNSTVKKHETFSKIVDFFLEVQWKF